MRIKLKRGIQRELIKNVKNKTNLSWKDLAIKLNIGNTYLSGELFNEKRLISKETYDELCKLLNKNYNKYIEDRLNNSWGRSKGGINSKRVEKLLIQKPSKELAELMGIIIGDGNIWVRKGGYYYLTITGDANKDEDYLSNYVRELFRSLFGKEMQVHKNKNNNGMYVKIGNKDIIFTLNHFGFPSGDKKENNIIIPIWIMKNEEYLKNCIRGMIDTDGSVVFLKGREYPYIWFSSNIPNIRRDFSSAMKILGFDTSKWNIRENHAADCYIAKKEHVVRFLKEVGFSNLKHAEKFRRISYADKEFLPLSSRGQIRALK